MSPDESITGNEIVYRKEAGRAHRFRSLLSRKSNCGTLRLPAQARFLQRNARDGSKRVIVIPGFSIQNACRMCFPP